MGEDCSFLVAFAAAPRAPRLPSVLVMWLLPIAVTVALIASGSDGCFDEDPFGTTSACNTNGSTPSTTRVGMRETTRSAATFSVGDHGTAIAERGYGGSGTACVSTGSHGSHGTMATFNRLSIQSSESRSASNVLANNDGGGGNGIVAGSRLCWSTDRQKGTREGVEQEGRNSGGDVDWCERDEASRRQDG